MEHKLAVLGGAGVGKSALIIQFTQGHFIEEYDPTLEDSYRKQLTIDSILCLLDIFETVAQADSSLREWYLRGSQGFILTYSITSRQSYEDLDFFREKIYRVRDTDHAPMVIVGNKCDLENDRQVTTHEAHELAKRWQVPMYETSALAHINIEEAFFDLVRQIRVELSTRNDPSVSKKGPQSGTKACALL